MRIDRSKGLSRLSAIAIVVASCAAAVGGGPERTIPTVLDLVTLEEVSPHASVGTLRFYVSQPDAAISAAWCHDPRLIDKAGNALPPIAGFELAGRVILRTKSLEAITAAANALPGMAIKPIAAAPGYWAISAGSVREAVAIAAELAEWQVFDEVSLDMTRPRALRELPNDPNLSSQWHLRNTQDPLFDVNAEAAWESGYTGAGVVIGIVERSWQKSHPDLAPNYNATASQSGGSLSSHATSVAGVAAAVGNNGLFGVGAAYGAQLSNQFYGTDSQIAFAFGYRNDLNDIKSNSWGPPDHGAIAHMAPIVRTAIEESVATGRGGLGEVFVWAAGNGGSANDRVDYDPFASSRFTIAVGGIGDGDVRASYNEKGSSMVVVAHSSGGARFISTTTSGSGWTSSFGGTSAAAPLAAGVIALMLEANPDLTWRDVQHVLINSARKNDPADADWTTNGAGHEINYEYGFGAVDAGAAVTLAESWNPVPHELDVDTGAVAVNIAIPDSDPNGSVETVSVADNIRIETVELILNVQTTMIGDLEILLTGPSGTESVLALQRPTDTQDDYVDYIFTSFRHWDEESGGDWTVKIADHAPGDLATWIDYRLVFHGTPVCPGDLDENGEIDVWDLMELLSAYHTCEGDASFKPAADINNDGCIAIYDLGHLLSIYNQSCP